MIASTGLHDERSACSSRMIPRTPACLLFLLLRASGLTQVSAAVGRNTDIEALRELLYPNHSVLSFSGRSLKGTYSETVPCVLCQGMKHCPNLNGFQLQEVYSPSDLIRKDTCLYVDKLGERIGKEIFGPGRTFRDSVQCRSIVLQYLCLFWGSNNNMYTNFCIFQEDVSDPNPLKHLLAPRPPCRSFCVQVAEICANDLNFLAICSEIACPPTGDACNPDPVVNGQVTAAGIGCAIPVEVSPYSYSAAFRTYDLAFVCALTVAASVLFVWIES